MKRFVITIVTSLINMCLFVNLGLSADFLEKNAVGIWLFDEGKGDVASDSSGNGNDGKITGAKWVEGKFGKALQIESPDVVTVPPSDSLNLKDAITIAAWVNMGEEVSDTAIRRQGGYLLEVQSPSEEVPGAFVFGIWSAGGFTGGVWGENIPEPGEWHHVAGIYNGKEMKILFDGELEASVKETGEIDSPADNLLFGTFSGEKFFGVLDEIVIFDKGLTEQEIQTLMKGVEAAKAVTPKDKLATTWGEIKDETKQCNRT